MPISSKKKHVVHLMIAEIVAGLVVNIFSLWVFLELSEKVFNRQIGMFDYIVTYVIQSLRSPVMTDFMKTITIFGGPGILATTLIIAFALSAYRHNRRSVMFLMLIVTGVALNLLLKVLFHRPRPNISPLVDEYTYSFPSGHAMNAFIFYMSVAYIFYHYTRDKILGIVTVIGLGMWVFLIGVSRVYLGVHYPSDVIAGFAGGLWWLLTVLIFEKIVAVEHLLHTSKRAS